MRFEELYELWNRDGSLLQVVNDSQRMMEHTFEMFRESLISLRENDDGDFNIDVYEKDQVVNQYIREVRLKMLKYLAVTGGMNIIPGLILTAIVIDIERLGDYTKNITDLALSHPRRLDGGEFEEDFQRIETAVSEMFEDLIEILEESDSGGAGRLIRNKQWIFDRCDEIVETFIIEENKKLTPRDAASRTLYARYLERVAAHLLNIAASIVNPLANLGLSGTAGDEEGENGEG